MRPEVEGTEGMGLATSMPGAARRSGRAGKPPPLAREPLLHPRLGGHERARPPLRAAPYPDALPRRRSRHMSGGAVRCSHASRPGPHHGRATGRRAEPHGRRRLQGVVRDRKTFIPGVGSRGKGTLDLGRPPRPLLLRLLLLEGVGGVAVGALLGLATRIPHVSALLAHPISHVLTSVRYPVSFPWKHINTFAPSRWSLFHARSLSQSFVSLLEALQ